MKGRFVCVLDVDVKSCKVYQARTLRKEKKFLLPCATTYLCEQKIFILINFIKQSTENMSNPKDNIRISLASKTPNFDVY